MAQLGRTLWRRRNDRRRQALRCNALGFRKLTNYRWRSLLHSGALHQTRQCTLNYEEPLLLCRRRIWRIP